MNKKMILLGVTALIGCFVLTSFDKKTLAQQKEEIAQAVTAKLDAFRAEKETACTESITAEANTRYQAWVAEEAAKPAAAGMKKTTKKTVKGGPKVDPLPQKTAPTDPQKTRGGAVQQGNVEQQKTRAGAVEPTNPEAQKKRGGAVKQGGGN